VITADQIADAAFEADLVADPFKVLAFARAIEAEALKSQQQAINAAVMAEREAIAQWYEADGWLMDEAGIPDAIRARTQPAPTSAQKESDDGK
jgi:hypothetical protein